MFYFIENQKIQESYLQNVVQHKLKKIVFSSIKQY